MTARPRGGQDPRLTAERLLGLALAMPGAVYDEPWEGHSVAKVGGKLFLFGGAEDRDDAVGLKCGRSREEADEWLVRFPADASVMAYIGRHGWNVLRVGGAIPDEDLVTAMHASYDDVVARLPRRARPTAGASEGRAEPARARADGRSPPR